MAGVGAPWVGHGELAGEGWGRGRGGAAGRRHGELLGRWGLDVGLPLLRVCSLLFVVSTDHEKKGNRTEEEEKRRERKEKKKGKKEKKRKENFSKHGNYFC
jgi:hypothetical protein